MPGENAMNDKLPPLKRIAAVHDLSGFGKCSLTVALPIISATGVECACIPTALLSTHTGGFTGWTFRDLSDQMLPIVEHWHREGVRFDGIYSGYLASPEQGELLSRAIDLIRNDDTLVIVDPAMADNGKYYANLDGRMAACFAKLFSKADAVTPNITEACFITGTEYVPGIVSEDYVNLLLDRISAMGPRIAAVTGVSMEPGRVGVAARQDGETTFVMNGAREGTFHGSGDVFASAFSALLVRGAKLTDAMGAAVALTADSIERTARRGTPRHYGLDFEGALPAYIAHISSLF